LVNATSFVIVSVVIAIAADRSLQAEVGVHIGIDIFGIAITVYIGNVHLQINIPNMYVLYNK
jgi:hypothetical protein